ncbi:unnamed protein product [Gadus morhua 'NCC']
MVEVVSVVVLEVVVGEEAACGGPLNHSVNGKDATTVAPLPNNEPSCGLVTRAHRLAALLTSPAGALTPALPPRSGPPPARLRRFLSVGRKCVRRRNPRAQDASAERPGLDSPRQTDHISRHTAMTVALETVARVVKQRYRGCQPRSRHRGGDECLRVMWTLAEPRSRSVASAPDQGTQRKPNHNQPQIKVGTRGQRSMRGDLSDGRTGGALAAAESHSSCFHGDTGGSVAEARPSAKLIDSNPITFE